MSKMKIGIIGCGTIANSAHIPSYLNNPDVEIKYFCDIIPERAQAAVEKYKCGTAVVDYHDVIADPEIEAVSVCTPNKMHSIISCDCLAAGKNVLCEKPAARTYADALKMQEAQHKAGKVLNIGVVNRFNGAVNKIREMIARGDLGEVYHVYVSFRSQRSIPGLGGAFTTKAEATCVSSGLKEAKCSRCTEVKQEIIPATGNHTDGNGDNLCDTCGKSLVEEKPMSFWDKIVAFFQNIINWFKNLFS